MHLSGESPVTTAAGTREKLAASLTMNQASRVAKEGNRRRVDDDTATLLQSTAQTTGLAFLPAKGKRLPTRFTFIRLARHPCFGGVQVQCHELTGKKREDSGLRFHTRFPLRMPASACTRVSFCERFDVSAFKHKTQNLNGCRRYGENVPTNGFNTVTACCRCPDGCDNKESQMRLFSTYVLLTMSSCSRTLHPDMQ